MLQMVLKMSKFFAALLITLEFPI